MIRVGTCSWAEKTLLQSGEFYPPEAGTAESRLRHYAEHFDVVEVDSAYYAMPAMQTVSLWSERTPPGFVFHIKAYAPLTGHGVDPRTLPKDLRTTVPENGKNRQHIYIKDASLLMAVAERFKENLRPLVRASKIGILVFQYPPWFVCSRRNMDYLITCRDLMAPLRVAVEFRHGSWLAEGKRAEVLGFLRDHGLLYVSADEPQFGDMRTIPFMPEVTGDTAYFRFHGRNRENWFKKGIETALRYAYEYSDGELGGFVPAIRQAGARAMQTYVMFNNCYRASAIKNALRMKELIRK